MAAIVASSTADAVASSGRRLHQHLATGRCLLVQRAWRPSVAVRALPQLRGSSQIHAATVHQDRCSTRLYSTALWVPPLAMVNVDFASPSLVLGFALIACGIALLQARNLQRRVSRDADIVVAAMISIVGSTLIFQGWRLDPLLLLCQALTTSVAVWYGLETFKLRSELESKAEEEQQQLPPPQDMYRPGAPEDFRGGVASSSGGYLPPGRAQAPWDPRQQQRGDFVGSSRWGRPFEEATRGYDSYVRPAQNAPYAEALPSALPQTAGDAPNNSQPGSLPPFLPAGQPGEVGYGAPPGSGYEAGPSQGAAGGYGQWYGTPDQEYGTGAGAYPPVEYPQQYPGPQGQGMYGQLPYDPSSSAAAAAGGAAGAQQGKQQQQQQPAAGGRPRDYERIDDWE